MGWEGVAESDWAAVEGMAGKQQTHKLHVRKGAGAPAAKPSSGTVLYVSSSGHAEERECVCIAQECLDVDR